MVPTYDYGPSSERSLRSTMHSMDSTRSVDSNTSTLADTVINHTTRNNMNHSKPLRSSYQLDNKLPQKQRFSNNQRQEKEEDDDYSDKQRHIEEHPTASSSPGYSTESEPDSPPRASNGQHYTASSAYSPGSSSMNNRSNATMASTIAVFGATTKTGQAFVRIALDAGYVVRALLGNSKKMDQQTNLDWIVGSLNDEQAIRDCVDQADFVVCTLAEHKFKKQKTLMREFILRLYPIMKEQRSIQVFLFQVRDGRIALYDGARVW